MAREHLLKIGVSGIRGVVGEFLTPSLACAFAQAFGTYVGAGRVVVGRDTRASGPMLQHAVHLRPAGGGLRSGGCRRAADADDPDVRRLHTRARRHRAHRVAQSARVQRAQAVQRAQGSSSTTTSAANCWTFTTRANSAQADERRDPQHVAGLRDAAPRLHIERVLRTWMWSDPGAQRFRVALDARERSGLGDERRRF